MSLFVNFLTEDDSDNFDFKETGWEMEGGLVSKGDF